MTDILPADYDVKLKTAAGILAGAQRIIILTHLSPDGDTLGSAFALCRALRAMGRRAAVRCSDELQPRYAYLWQGLAPDDFEPDLTVSSDVASASLLGDKLAGMAGRIGLCIDHHPSNNLAAGFALIDPHAAATCEITADLIQCLGAEIDKNIAECVYTGLATDTGCFRFSSTRAKTLRTAALMVDRGADTARINKLLFDTVSRARMQAESMILSTLEFYCGGRCAMITVPREVLAKTGLTEPDLEGIPGIPIRIEGVLAGVTVKEKEDGEYKISLRTCDCVDASAVCGVFGGGGHRNAAGCTLNGSLGEVKSRLTAAIAAVMPSAMPSAIPADAVTPGPEAQR